MAARSISSMPQLGCGDEGYTGEMVGHLKMTAFPSKSIVLIFVIIVLLLLFGVFFFCYLFNISYLIKMVVESILPLLLRQWPAVLAVGLIAYLLKNYFNHGLNQYPGPLLAGFTNWWRFFDVYGGRPEVTHIALHRKHGDVVRLGPNYITFSNPAALKAIYGLNKGFVKARYSGTQFIHVLTLVS